MVRRLHFPEITFRPAACVPPTGQAAGLPHGGHRSSPFDAKGDHK
jgi:hypothetical protein